MPTLLYLDTSGTKATVAVSRNTELLSVKMHEGSREQAALLNLMIGEALEEAGMTLDAIDAVCVCGGPGSYTGLRVSLATAKGIAFALGKPILLFDKLLLVAAGLRSAEFFQKEKAIVLKARKGEYFFALFDQGQNVLVSPAHIFEGPLLTMLHSLKDKAIGITDDETLDIDMEKYILPGNFQPDIAAWAHLAEERAAKEDWDDLAYCEPYYLKEAFTTQSKKWKA